MTTRIAMIGAGAVARRHVATLSRLASVRVTSVADPVQSAAESLAADCGARAFSDVVRALDTESVDAVYVCVPPFAHGAIEREVLARGLPMFVEKPVAVDEATARELAELVAEAGVVTGTGYHWRCLDFVERARRELADRPAMLAEGSWLGGRPPVAWWADPARSGGQVVEQLTHVLDLLRLLLGEVDEVHAVGARDPEAATEEVDDATAAVVRLASGAAATLTATSVLPGLHRAALHTYSRGMTLELSQTGLVVDRDGRRRIHEPAEDPRVVVDREFVAAVRGEREGTRTPYDEAVRSHLLACAVTRSARDGVPARVELVP